MIRPEVKEKRKKIKEDKIMKQINEYLFHHCNIDDVDGKLIFFKKNINRMFLYHLPFKTFTYTKSIYWYKAYLKYSKHNIRQEKFNRIK